MSFYGKNYATGCLFLIKIMRQGITIDKKIMQQGIMWKGIFYISLETMDFGKNSMRQGILLGHFLCDRVQGVESFATHPCHFPSQVPLPWGTTVRAKRAKSCVRTTVRLTYMRQPSSTV